VSAPASAARSPANAATSEIKLDLPPWSDGATRTL
jgi:hypothetical protein